MQAARDDARAPECGGGQPQHAGAAGLSATECSEQTGLSRVSARRYLEHLAGAGSAAVSARYGGTGRPERRFRAR